MEIPLKIVWKIFSTITIHAIKAENEIGLSATPLKIKTLILFIIII